MNKVPNWCSTELSSFLSYQTPTRVRAQHQASASCLPGVQSAAVACSDGPVQRSLAMGKLHIHEAYKEVVQPPAAVPY